MYHAPHEQRKFKRLTARQRCTVAKQRKQRKAHNLEIAEKFIFELFFNNALKQHLNVMIFFPGAETV